MSKTIKERILSHVAINPSTGCWIWTGYINPSGYASMTINYGPKYAHRVSYEIYVGSILDGFTIDHLCKTKSCVNPQHLEMVTLQENILRGTGRAAINAAKTHCINGHAFTGDNLGRTPKGTRYCKACVRVREKKCRDRHK